MPRFHFLRAVLEDVACIVVKGVVGGELEELLGPVELSEVAHVGLNAIQAGDHCSCQKSA